MTDRIPTQRVLISIGISYAIGFVFAFIVASSSGCEAIRSTDHGYLTARTLDSGVVQHCTSLDCKPLRWRLDQIPVTVAADVANQDDLDRLEDVLSHINQRLGFEMVTHVANPDGATVVVRFNVPFEVGRHDRRRLGACYHHYQSGNLRGEVALRYVGNIRQSFELLLHELGHCALLLSHDDTQGSVMYPESRLAWDPVDGTPNPSLNDYWILDADRRRLREDYNR